MSELEKKQMSNDAIENLKDVYKQFVTLQREVMTENVDFGFPAGRGHGKKPSLYKAGAEKLTRLFNLTPKFEITNSIEKDDFIMYQFKCDMYSNEGKYIATGYGACNSKEKRNWKSNPWAAQNTILKIGKKRAHVDGVLTSTGASNAFTQDIEDLNPEVLEDNVPAASAKKTTEKPKKTNDPIIKTLKKSEQMDIKAKFEELINKVAKETAMPKDEIRESYITSKYNRKLEELTKNEARAVWGALSEVITR